MAHNILDSMFAGVRAPAWHQLGKVYYDGPVPCQQACVENGMDFEIVTMPTTVAIGGVQVPTGQVAIVRLPYPGEPDPAFLGNATPSYQLLQNLDIAKMLDTNLPTMPLETMGVLGEGETFFVTLDDGEDDVLPGKETVKNYFLVTDTRNGRSALTMAYTPVRVVCQNTLTMGLAAASVQWSLSHEDRLQYNANMQTRIMGQLRQAKQKSLDVLRKMATTRLVADQITHIVNAAYPLPDSPRWVRTIKSLDEFGVTLEAAEQKYMDRSEQIAAASRDRMLERRDGAMQLIEKIGDEYPDIGGTTYAAWNGVVELEDWRRSNREKANVEFAVLFGDRAKAKALAYRAAVATLS